MAKGKEFESYPQLRDQIYAKESDNLEGQVLEASLQKITSSDEEVKQDEPDSAEGLSTIKSNASRYIVG